MTISIDVCCVPITTPSTSFSISKDLSDADIVVTFGSGIHGRKNCKNIDALTFFLLSTFWFAKKRSVSARLCDFHLKESSQSNSLSLVFTWEVLISFLETHSALQKKSDSIKTKTTIGEHAKLKCLNILVLPVWAC